MTLRWHGEQRKREIERGLSRAVLQTAHSIRNEMIRLILDTAKSGKTYKRGGKSHVASAPGEPPASDHGTLIRSIRVKHSGLSASVIIGGAAKLLEYGTSKMAARPFVRPAVANISKTIERTAGITIKSELR